MKIGSTPLQKLQRTHTWEILIKNIDKNRNLHFITISYVKRLTTQKNKPSLERWTLQIILICPFCNKYRYRIITLYPMKYPSII